MRTTLSLITASLLIASPTAFAANANVIVQANVKGTCQFESGADTILNFGDLNETMGETKITGSTTFWCSNGTQYTVTADDGLNGVSGQKKMLVNTSEIPYSLALSNDQGTGAGKTAPITLGLEATIADGVLANADIIDGYTDTVKLTIAP